MNIFKPFTKIGQFFTWLITKTFSWEFLFGVGLTFGKRFFRIFGLIAFISTFIVAGSVALNTDAQPLNQLGVFGIEIVKDIITTDQYIYERALTFHTIQNPTLFQGIIESFIILKSTFYYIWWYRIIFNLVKKHSWMFPISTISSFFGLKEEERNMSTHDSKISWVSFKILYVLMIFSNISYMIWISKDITFDFIMITTFFDYLKNIFIFIDTLLVKHWWHWIVGFKGIIFSIVLVYVKTIFLFMGKEFTIKVSESLINTTNTTI